MPRLMEDAGKRARCPTCRKVFPVVESQIGCCVECPYCHAAFRLFENDIVKKRRLVMHPQAVHRRHYDGLLIAGMLFIAIGALGLLYFVWKRTIETVARRPEVFGGNDSIVSVTEGPRSDAQTSSPLEEAETAQETRTLVDASAASSAPSIESIAGQVPAVTSVVLAVRQVGMAGPPVAPAEKGEAVEEWPFSVYRDCVGSLPYIPSGYMGNFADMDFDDCCTTKPHSGDSCISITYRAPHQWVGVAWQDPPNNWGDIPGGYDLRGATKLTFWARGKTGAERVEFKMGLIGRTKKYADSARVTTGKVRLTKDWRRYEIPLSGLDLSRIITAFVVVLEGAPTPTVIYLDDICFE